jgi:hypothetical protein
MQCKYTENCKENFYTGIQAHISFKMNAVFQSIWAGAHTGKQLMHAGKSMRVLVNRLLGEGEGGLWSKFIEFEQANNA